MLYTVYALAGQEHLVPFAVSARAGKERLVPFAVSASAGKERLVLFAVSAHAGNERLCRLLGSCERGALVSPFRLVRTRSFGCYRFVKRFGRGVPRNLHSKEP